MSVRRKNKGKRQVRVVVTLSVLTLLLITTGYAAVSTNVTLNAKGNIVKDDTASKKALKNIQSKTSLAAANLYKDETDEANTRYIYKGDDPDNYIIIQEDNEDVLWRIYSYEDDGTIKIVRNDVLLEAQSWDTNDQNTWADTNENTFASLNTYLNTENVLKSLNFDDSWITLV